MIKKEIIRTGHKSYFKPHDEDIYDLERETIWRIKIFGITIWEKQDIMKDSEIINLNNKNKVGFEK